MHGILMDEMWDEMAWLMGLVCGKGRGIVGGV